MNYHDDHPYYKAVSKVLNEYDIHEPQLIEDILDSLFLNPVDIRKWTEEQILASKGEMRFS